MDIAQRLTNSREAAKLSQEELAKLVGLTQQAIDSIEQGKTRQPRKLKEIADALNVTPQWLQFGSAISAHEPSGDYQVSSLKYAMVRRYTVGAGMVEGKENSHEEVNGTHAYRREWLERKLLDPAKCAVIDAVGDSMFPSIHDGDIVLVNTAAAAIINGRAYAFRSEDGVKLKRLFKQLDGSIRVASDNPDKISYPDEWLTAAGRAEIIGEVVHRAGGV